MPLREPTFSRLTYLAHEFVVSVRSGVLCNCVTLRTRLRQPVNMWTVYHVEGPRQEELRFAFLTIALPNLIRVYNFIVNPAEIPADSSIRGEVSGPSTQPTAEQLETGRQLGALTAQDLVTDLQVLGLAALCTCEACLRDLGRNRRRCRLRSDRAATNGRLTQFGGVNSAVITSLSLKW